MTAGMRTTPDTPTTPQELGSPSLLDAAQRHLERSTYLLLDQPTPIIIPLEIRAAAAQANAITAYAYLLLAKESQA